MKASMKRRLSRRIWMRHPTRKCRYLFAPDGPGLIIEPATDSGLEVFLKARKVMKERLPAGSYVSTGALLVDGGGRFVFAGRRAGPELLAALGAWCRKHVREVPSVAGLAGAGVATCDVDPRDPAALDAVDVDALDVHRDPDVWAGLLVADVATVAAVLEAVTPGTRLWFWLDPAAGKDDPALLLQPVSWDVNRDRIDTLIGQMGDRRQREESDDTGVSGIALPVDDGTLQFLGADLTRVHLERLAAFARSHVRSYPALGRLRDAVLLVTSGSSTVTERIADPELWAGIPAVVAPGTVGETEAVLGALEAGQSAWFWLAATPGSEASFLAVRAADADPDGVGFGEFAGELALRFASLVGAPIHGVVRRLGSGALLFATASADLDGWPHAMRQLAAQHTGLSSLANARLIQLEDGVVTSALTAD